MNNKFSLQILGQILVTIFAISTWGTLSGQVNFQPLYTESTLDNRLTNTNLAVGSIGASADVTNGAASYVIPIQVPAGTNGVVPSVSISYNSFGNSGHLGFGWSINGLSAITRSIKTLYHDGVVAPVKLNAEDRFAIDGVRLMAKTGTYGSAGTVYGKEMEDFSRITSYGNVGGGPEWWKVEMKDGVVMEYGRTVDSRFMNEANSVVLFWRLNRTIYPDSNYIDYVYNNIDRDSRIDEIRYTGNLSTGLTPYNIVKFEYLDRGADFDHTSYEAGSSVRTKYILNKIIITADSETPFKSYEILYGNDLKNIFMTEITEKGSDGSALNSSIFHYGDPPDVVVPAIQVGGSSSQDTDIFTGDYNGDGLTDMAEMNWEDLGGDIFYRNFSVYRNNGNNGSFVLSYNKIVSQVGNIAKASSPYNFFAGDFDGDGADDILYSFVGGQDPYHFNGCTLFKFNSNINTAIETNIPRPSEIYKNIHSGKKFMVTGDFNGDGRNDIILLLSNVFISDLKAYIYYGGISTAFAEIFVGGGGAVYHNITDWGAKNINALDFDGDGKTELMITKGLFSEIFSINGQIATSIHAAGFPTEYHLMWFGDLNGDKKTDMLVRPSLNDDVSWNVAYSTGTGFIENSFGWHGGNSPQINEDYQGTIVHIADFNGDGRMDIFKGRTSTSILYEINYSTGDGFYKFLGSWPHETNAFIAGTGDFNGDGRSDFITRTSSTSAKKTIMINALSKDLQLLKAKNGHGHVTEWRYRRMTENTTYTKTGATAHPVNTIRVPMYLVDAFYQSNVIPTIYDYWDMKLHKEGRGQLGFAKIVKSNPSTERSEETELELNTAHYLMLPRYIRNKKGNATLNLKEITNMVTQQNTGATQKILWHRVIGTFDDNLFEGRYLSTSNAYDIYGNVITSSVANSDISITTVTSTYGAHGSYIPNQIESTTTSGLYLGANGYSTTTQYQYTPLGQLSQKIEFAGLAKAVTTEYGYNALGNQNTTTITAAGLTPRQSSSIYDPKGRYVVSATNTLGQVSTINEYDVRWAKPKVTTGIGGLITEYDYDAFGRLIKTTMSEGFEVDVEYTLIPSSFDKYKIKKIHPGQPDVTTYYDLSDRVRRTEIEGYNGTTITTSMTYDSKGRPSTQTNPYKSGETPLVTTTVYDDYDRVVSVSNAINTSTISYSYAAGKLTTTTTKVIPSTGNQVNSVVTDAVDRVLTATDYGGSLQYTYHVMGMPLEVKLGGNTLVTYEYDAYARKTKATEINSGTISYDYDAYGQLVSETNQLGHTTTHMYNDLGQITSKVGAEGTSSYNYYGTGTASVNQLQQITSFGGNIEAMVYDIYGRLTSYSHTIDGQTYTTSQTYNIYGQQTSITYPSGFGLQYVYDANGYQQTIKNLDNSKTLFTNGSMNGYQQYTTYTLSNNRAFTKTYHHSIPTRVQATGGLHSPLDWTYTWDYASGNLMGRHLFQAETFEYDNLNRLTQTTHPASAITVDYNTHGNITGKTDAGPDYTYDTQRIHAMSGITTPNYPNNINLAAQNISYTTYLQPHIITEGGHKLEYTYAQDHQRIKSVRSLDGVVQETITYLGDYERQEINGNINDIHYVHAGGQLSYIVVRTNGGPFKFYYTYTDYLGSIMQVVNDESSSLGSTELNFDAWGRRRNINLEYTNLLPIDEWLYRGYTGHEHMREFRLVNMNGRMYDPVLGRMLSVDNVITMPGTTQSFNRYSYVNNNPLKYTDPDGQLPVLAVFAIKAAIGAAIGVAANGINNVIHHQNFFSGAGNAALYGAIGGVISSGIGALAKSFGASSSTAIFQINFHGFSGAVMSFAQGGNPFAGFASGSISSVVSSSVMSLGGGATATLIGGAVSGGIGSSVSGGSFWMGVQQGLITSGLNHLAHRVAGSVGDPPSTLDRLAAQAEQMMQKLEEMKGSISEGIEYVDTGFDFGGLGVPRDINSRMPMGVLRQKLKPADLRNFKFRYFKNVIRGPKGYYFLKGLNLGSSLVGPASIAMSAVSDQSIGWKAADFYMTGIATYGGGVGVGIAASYNFLFKPFAQNYDPKYYTPVHSLPKFPPW